MLPKTSAYLKSYVGQTKWMYILIEDDDFWKNIILSGIKNFFKKADSQPTTIKTFWKPKIKSYSGKATDFYDKKICNAGSNHVYLIVITISSALRIDESYSLQVVSKCKYIEKEVIRHIT